MMRGFETAWLTGQSPVWLASRAVLRQQGCLLVLAKGTRA